MWKIFYKKKGVKQHILRMHVGKPKTIIGEEIGVTAMNLPVTLNAEEQQVNHLQFSRIISVENSPKSMLSPAHKKLRRGENESDHDNDKESLDNSEFIKHLLVEVQDNAISKVQEGTDVNNQNNYQCGECG